MPPSGVRIYFFLAVPGVWGFESSLSTPSQAAPYGAPPPGYFMAPQGSEFRSLRSPNSDLSLCANSCINLNNPVFFMIFFLLLLTFSRIDVTMPLVPVSATVGASHKVAAKGWGLK